MAQNKVSAKELAFAEFLDLYQNDPVQFVRDVVGVDPQPWQIAALQAVAQGKRRIAVRSGHGVGKSSCASWLMLWHLLCRFPQKAVVTAPTASQLFDALFAELKGTIKNLPDMLKELIVASTDKVHLAHAPEESFISARTSRAETPEALQGVHAPHVLLVVDEASGVPEAVFEAAVGSMSGHNAITLLLGNPTRSSGYFYNAFHKNAEQWHCIHVNAAESKLVSKAFVDQVAQTYGENSNAFRVRVLGEFPLADDDTVISWELANTAMHRDISVGENVPVVWGVDVARFGDDESCLVKRQGNIVIEPPRNFKKIDLMQLTGIIKSEYDASPVASRPIEIFVDSIGVGGGVVDRLRELGLPVRGVNVSESPALGATYVNLRAELWYKLKTWLEQRNCKLPKDDALLAELIAPKYFFQSNGKIQIEGKEQMKRRGIKSPNKADALCLTFASDAAVGIYGTSFTSKWNQPLKRNLARLA